MSEIFRYKCNICFYSYSIKLSGIIFSYNTTADSSTITLFQLQNNQSLQFVTIFYKYYS